MGWPSASRPPEGLTGSRPPRVVAPESANSPPEPIGQKPISSVCRSSPKAAAWTSATETSSGPTPASSYARCAVRRLTEGPVGRAAVRRRSPAVSTTTTAAAPSVSGAHMGTASGSLSVRAARMCSAVRAVAHFSRAFKQAYGVTPSSVRRGSVRQFRASHSAPHTSPHMRTTVDNRVSTMYK